MNGRELAFRNGVAVEQVRGKAGCQDDHHRAGDDLIHLEAGGEGGVEQSHDPSHSQGNDDAKEKAEQQRPIVGGDFGHERRKGPGQHHAFDADIDDA